MIADTVETPIAQVAIRITAAVENNDWLVVTTPDDVYPLKPSESVELLSKPGITVFGLTGRQEYALEYFRCN